VGIAWVLRKLFKKSTYVKSFFKWLKKKILWNSFIRFLV
jgi:hypothetical protein